MHTNTILLVATAAGGALGAAWATSKRERSSLWVVFLEIVMGAVSATAVSDLYRVSEAPTVNALIGVFAGMTSGFVLDTLAEIMPDFAKTLVKKGMGKLTGKGDNEWQ